MSRLIRRAPALLLLLLIGAALAGCAARDDTNDKDRHGGFYGGVFGGMTR